MIENIIDLIFTLILTSVVMFMAAALIAIAIGPNPIFLIFPIVIALFFWFLMFVA